MQMILPMAELRPAEPSAPALQDVIDPTTYDVVICGFSGGKDSVACVLALLELGVRPELWHHNVDGAEDERPELEWDWPVTPDYCRKFAAAFGLPIYFSWRVGGLTGELLKQDARTQPVRYETPDGIGQSGGINGKIATRRKFPAIGPDLRTRWCSPVVKIDVMSAAIAGQERFRGKRVLVVTGERAEESANRAGYASSEPHRNHQPGPRARRHVDHWRPVLRWNERQVWQIMERHRVRAHPCYELGFGRASCMTCIFLDKDDLATVDVLDPSRLEKISSLEKDFGCTLKRVGHIKSHSEAGRAYDVHPEIARLAMSRSYDAEIITENWTLPAGAYRRGGGPV